MIEQKTEYIEEQTDVMLAGDTKSPQAPVGDDCIQEFVDGLDLTGPNVKAH